MILTSPGDRTSTAACTRAPAGVGLKEPVPPSQGWGLRCSNPTAPSAALQYLSSRPRLHWSPAHGAGISPPIGFATCLLELITELLPDSHMQTLLCFSRGVPPTFDPCKSSGCMSPSLATSGLPGTRGCRLRRLGAECLHPAAGMIASQCRRVMRRFLILRSLPPISKPGLSEKKQGVHGES